MNAAIRKIISKGIVTAMVISMPFNAFAKSEKTGISKEIKEVERELDGIERKIDNISDEMDDYFDRIEDQIEDTGKKEPVEDTEENKKEDESAEKEEVNQDVNKDKMIVIIKGIDVITGNTIQENIYTTDTTYEFSPEELEGYTVINNNKRTVYYKPGKKVTLVIKYKSNKLSKSNYTEYEYDEEDKSDVGSSDVATDKEDTEDILNPQPGNSEIDEDLSGQSFRAKLEVLKDRLDSIKKQLADLAKSKDATEDDIDDIEDLYDEIEDLYEEIQEELEEIDEFQEEIAEKMAEKDQKEYKAKKDKVSKDKVWSIKFNEEISKETISGLNVFIVDGKKNLIHVTTDYNSENNSLNITPDEKYIKGQYYTLFISKEIKSKNGKGLKNAVKMNFTIE